MSQHIHSDSSFRDSFLEGAAKAFFAMAYAAYVEEGDSTDNDLDEVERNERANLPRARNGGDWMDCIPEVPPNAYALAGELWAGLHAANGKAGVYSLALHAEAADGEAPDPEEFGHYLAMQAMGTGVSWFDDHKRFNLKVPSIECHDSTFSEDAYKA